MEQPQSCLFSGFFQLHIDNSDPLHWYESQSCLFSGFFQPVSGRSPAGEGLSQSCLFSGFFQPGQVRVRKRGRVYSSQSCLFSGFFQLFILLHFCHNWDLNLCRNPVYFQDFFNIEVLLECYKQCHKMSQSCLFSGFFQQSLYFTVTDRKL